MNFIRLIDTCVLRFFQFLTDKCQSWFGWDNFQIAIVLLAFSTGWTVVLTFRDLFQGHIVQALMFLYSCLSWMVINIAWFITSKRSCSSGKFRNKTEESCWVFRLMFLLMHVFMTKNILLCLFADSVSVMIVLGYVSQTCWVSTLYFMSCTPNPPSVSNVRKMINLIVEFFSPQFLPQPT